MAPAAPCPGRGLHPEALPAAGAMFPSDFYSDRKFCEHCQAYVSYLQSTDHSYCVQCGLAVRLFSDEDWTAFNESLQERRPKGGRPPRGRKRDPGRESA